MITSTQNLASHKSDLHLFSPNSDNIRSSMNNLDHSKIIHTAFVSLRAEESSGAGTPRVSTGTIESVMETPAFKAIVQASLDLSQGQGLSELEAAKQVIQTIRDLDQIWQSLLIKEGLKNLGSSNISH